MIGDSTMHSRWGDIVGRYFDESKVEVVNYAQGGKSSKSFRGEGLWDEVADAMQANDWLVIQFGHNDEKDQDPLRYTEPFTTFKENLQNYALEARAKGANPIICTPMVRTNLDSHGDYPDGAILAAQEINVPLVDIHAMTYEYVDNLDDPGDFAPDGSHTREEGSTVVAEFFVEDIKKQNLPLACYLK
jgi:lysophospholipase L1-like esterase